MKRIPDDVRHLRDRAQELRSQAQSFRFAENRAMLLNMAEHYERFAREIEVEIWERERRFVRL